MPDFIKSTPKPEGNPGSSVKVINAPLQAHKGSALDFIVKRRWIIPLSLIILYAIAFSILYPSVFLSPYNLTSVALEFSVPVMIAIGMGIQLIGGEIDLSVGYGVMFSVTASGYLLVHGFPLWVCVLLPILVTSVVGLIVGTLVARVGVNSFIATLGSGLVFYGFGLVLAEAGRSVINANGISTAHLPQDFAKIGQFPIWTFPDGGQITLPVVYAVILIVVFTLLLSRNPFFRKYYFVGMNKEAAAFSGINVKLMKTLQFVFSAALAGFGGIVFAARMGSASASLGIGMELNAITACVIGGISMWGGTGSMLGGVLGCLFMMCLSNGLRIANAPSNIYNIINGLVLLAAVITDSMFSRHKTVG